MKEYDFAFSCGYSCAVTEALRAADLQFASFPFDWTASPGFRRCAKMIADDFKGWMEKDDLELVDIRRLENIPIAFAFIARFLYASNCSLNC